ncbi:MAG: WbqC family protein [Anaerolineae bacterium]|nr:WbqC family protein [Anaerolineae bacterium]
MLTTSLKRVGIIQSCYIPWRGYFDFIDSVDLFVIYDDVLYSKGSWRNRNQIKLCDGLKWLTVPVNVKLGMTIDEVPIHHGGKSWENHHRCLLGEALKEAPFFKEAMMLWDAGISASVNTISQLNVRLIYAICAYLQITTPIIMSRDYNLTGAKTERLIQLLTKLKANVYLSGPAAKNYLDESLFREHGIRLEYKTYDYEPYPQLWGDFIGTVTVLDLIGNVGPESRRYLKSNTPNQLAVP